MSVHDQSLSWPSARKGLFQPRSWVAAIGTASLLALGYFLFSAVESARNAARSAQTT